MFGKKYLISVMLENPKDAIQVSAMENLGAVNTELDIYPAAMVLQKPRRYLSAVKTSLKYSKMGIHNAILKKS